MLTIRDEYAFFIDLGNSKRLLESQLLRGFADNPGFFRVERCRDELGRGVLKLKLFVFVAIGLFVL